MLQVGGMENLLSGGCCADVVCECNLNFVSVS